MTTTTTYSGDQCFHNCHRQQNEGECNTKKVRKDIVQTYLSDTNSEMEMKEKGDEVVRKTYNCDLFVFAFEL